MRFITWRMIKANKILGFNAHIVVEPYSAPINISKFSNSQIKNLSKDFMLTNSGEAVILTKKATKGKESRVSALANRRRK